MTDLRRRLERVDIAGEHDARARTWAVVESAFRSRDVARRPRAMLRPALVLAAAAAVVASAASPAGRAVIASVRDAVGERGSPRLFSLPAPGRLLAASNAGAWIVARDGTATRLGGYRDAAWSPFGRFVVAARANALVALEPDGDERWTLRRSDVRRPAWGGSRADTRIAYLSDNALRVVAGDRTRDRALIRGPTLRRSPLAWRPGDGHVLTYVAGDVLRVVAADRAEELWTTRLAPPIAVEWSDDGKRLLALSARALTVFAGGRRVARTPLPAGTRPVAAAFEPRGWRIAFALYFPRADRSEIRLGGRRVFAGAGRFSDVDWSPDGRWLVVAWRDADQWVFVRTTRPHRIETVSNVSSEFAGSFPRLRGWCCP